MIMNFFLQGDGDYELATDVEIDDFLWERIKKVRAYELLSVMIQSASNLKVFMELGNAVILSD